MNIDLMQRILLSRLTSGDQIDISVEGVSMEPSLKEGDTVSVKQYEEYSIGDILVFTYKGSILVHRLVKIGSGRYFCKGDNALRIEDMPIDDIFGKVVLINGERFENIPEYYTELSYKIGKIFKKCGYDTEKARNSGEFRFYIQALSGILDPTILFEKNNELDYIPADETSLAIFDPESGDTHFLSETAIDVLSCTENECNILTLLDKLCEIYDATPEEIARDVIEFLAEMIVKKIILVK